MAELCGDVNAGAAFGVSYARICGSSSKIEEQLLQIIEFRYLHQPEATAHRLSNVPVL